jgi:primosomal protein N' (replication factor Y) (superfamily II helicase)
MSPHSTNTSFRYAEIILPLNLPQTLTYGIPIELQGELVIGMRVEVSLGKNKVFSGIVERLHNDAPDAYQIKPIRNIIDQAPIVNEMQLKFWRWIGHYYVASPGEVMQGALPAHLKLMSETRLEWAGGNNHENINWSDDTYLAVEALVIKKELTISELREIVSSAHLPRVINELIEHEVVFVNEGLEESYLPRKEKIVMLAVEYKGDAAMKLLFDKLQRAPKQLDLLMVYIELSMKYGYVRQSELIERSKSNSAQLKTLVDKSYFTIEQRDIDRLNYIPGQKAPKLELTVAQETAFTTLQASLEKKDVCLLQGVTGSGKTLLYIQKIKECIASGKQAIFLLPEIALTTQLVTRLHAYFGEEMGVYHSRFSNNERVEIWEKVRRGTYKIVLGTRSALWLPYNNLGIIIVDEEHDASYKQNDPAPRFHARDAAIYLATLYDAKIILGSATPSIESLYNVQQKKYGYVQLKERYQSVNMPQIKIVDARSLETVRKQGIKLLTPELQEAMTRALQQNKQIILFQNKRGYAPFQMCTMCGWVPQCKNCSVSLTYHKYTDKLHCHYCGLKTRVLHSCMKCGSSNLQSKSFGTEKIEEEVKQVFPKARVARMDIDSMRGKQRFTQLLDQLLQHKIDVLVGTQMVVKGLDFAKVSLVGILSADSLLGFPDFRINERGFQLMSQVSGRAGRAEGDGEVIIQAYNIQHPVLQWVKEQDFKAFYQSEISYRQQFNYPPFSRLIKIIFKHKDETRAIDAATDMAKALNELEGLIVQGPVPAGIARVRNQYVQEVWIKCPKEASLLDKVKNIMKTQKNMTLARRGFSTVQIIFDIDPV